VKIDLPTTTFRASRMDDDTIVQATAQMWKDHHYVLDPHTACAFTDMAQDRVSIVLSTASPAKFPEVVQQATGSEPIHPSLEALKAKDMRRWPLEVTTDAVKAFIREKKV
jgi:threonine synthase